MLPLLDALLDESEATDDSLLDELIDGIELAMLVDELDEVMELLGFDEDLLFDPPQATSVALRISVTNKLILMFFSRCLIIEDIYLWYYHCYHF